MVNITDNLCTKQGNYSIKSVVYNQERVIMVRVRYIFFFLNGNHILPTLLGKVVKVEKTFGKRTLLGFVRCTGPDVNSQYP